jgi:GNAT superfamily N-acetyltransferase
MVQFALLKPPASLQYAAMTFPAYRHLLALAPARRHADDSVGRMIQPVAVGACDSDEPVGLALAETPLDTQTDPELLSVYVSAPRRNEGIGATLLASLESELRERGFHRLSTVYMTGKPGIAVFEHLLQRAGWDPPAVRSICIRFTREDVERATWLNKHRVVRGYEIFPWNELKEEERLALRRSQEESSWIPADLQPWDHDRHGFEPITSLGMRGPDGVVGWVINHEISPTVLRYTCSYIRPDLARRGRIVALYAASLRRLALTNYQSCTFVAPARHERMAAFAKRWCGPWASFLGETRGSSKVLR